MLRGLGYRVYRLSTIAFELIAPMARQPEIVSRRFASKRLGNNVIDFEWDAGYRFGAQAISTSMACVFSD